MGVRLAQAEIEDDSRTEARVVLGTRRGSAHTASLERKLARQAREHAAGVGDDRAAILRTPQEATVGAVVVRGARVLRGRRPRRVNVRGPTQPLWD